MTVEDDDEEAGAHDAESKGLADQVGQRNDQERAEQGRQPVQDDRADLPHLVCLPRGILRPQREVEAGEPGEAHADRGDRVEKSRVAHLTELNLRPYDAERSEYVVKVSGRWTG
jgi:hypothetical protein